MVVKALSPQPGHQIEKDASEETYHECEFVSRIQWHYQYIHDEPYFIRMEHLTPTNPTPNMQWNHDFVIIYKVLYLIMYL